MGTSVIEFTYCGAPRKQADLQHSASIFAVPADHDNSVCSSVSAPLRAMRFKRTSEKMSAEDEGTYAASLVALDCKSDISSQQHFLLLVPLSRDVRDTCSVFVHLYAYAGFHRIAWSAYIDDEKKHKMHRTCITGKQCHAQQVEGETFFK